MKHVTAAVLLLLALTGCGGGEETTEDAAATTSSASTTTSATTTESETPETTTTEEDDPYAPNVGDRALQVGEPRKGTAVTTTVLEVRDLTPEAPDFAKLDLEGWSILGIRARVCVKDLEDAEGGAELAWSDFVATDKQSNQYKGSSSSWNEWPRPQFPTYAVVNPGECVQGWLWTEVPKPDAITKILLRPVGAGTIAEWLV